MEMEGEEKAGGGRKKGSEREENWKAREKGRMKG